MSNASSEPAAQNAKWNPWLGAAYALFVFIGVQFVSGLLLSLYPFAQGWSYDQSVNWLNDSLAAKLSFIAINAVLVLLAIRFFLKLNKAKFSDIGLGRFNFGYLGYSLAGFFVYFVSLIPVVMIASALIPSLNVDQEQELGFDAIGSYSGVELGLIALLLVVITPIIEEVVFRGLLHGSLKKIMKVWLAAIATSFLFAIGHLTASSEGPLYIAAIDTFVLSLVLVYLREKTGSLWASIGLHAIKNGIAFITVFIVGVS